MQTHDATARLSTELLDDHRQLETFIQDVAGACEAGDVPTLRAAWSRFDTELRRHMDWEEMWLFPRFAVDQPDQARRIADEHEDLRNRLLDLGLRIDTQCARADDIDAFLDALRSHAAGENVWLYAWADRTVPAGERRDLLARLRDRVSSRLHGSASGIHAH
jgi:hypothetical protein